MTTTNRTAEAIAEDWAASYAEGDLERFEGLLSPSVHYRELSPNGLAEFNSARELLDYAGADLQAADLELLSARAERFGDRVALSFTVRATSDDGPRVFRMHGFLDIEDERIAAMDLLCSGFAPA